MTIHIAIGDGTSTVAIKPEGIIGAYAVHQQIIGGAAIGLLWTVSHIASGMAIWHVRTIAQAIKVAQWLDTEGPIPRDGGIAELRAWRRALSGGAYLDLVTQLQTLAPRVIPLDPSPAVLENTQ